MKGNLLDILFIPIIFLVIVIGTVLGAYLYGNIKDSLMANEQINQTVEPYLNEGEKAMYNFDYVLLFVLLGLFATSFISALFINTHPIFFFLSIFFLAISIFLISHLKTIYSTFYNVTEFQGVLYQFKITNWIMSNQILVYFALSLPIVVALYMKITS